MPNRLADATSPYLLQHAGNPVAWYPWGGEAFAAAQTTGRPILLSIGYSACHWCHVMAHESFENQAIAERMNTLFVNVKVDREERPDVDAVYMEAVQAMTGHGGWPLTVFLTPDREPFYGGTYFPPTPRGGMIGFGQLLEAVAQAWHGRPADVRATAADLTEMLRQASVLKPSPEAPSAAVVARAAERMMAAADRRHGGMGGAPKFPQVSNLSFLLGRHVRTGETEPLVVVTAALDAMAAGGIYDHLGGGFHRYSVDAAWAVPHFEKMLYDNAQLLRLYTEAWQVTARAAYRRVAEETAEYLLREMTAPAGGFYSTQDADSPGGEGATFVWTPEAVRAALSPEDAAAACAWYGVTPGGNHDGATVLATRRTLVDVAAALGTTEETLRERLARARDGLFTARAERPQPATDTKILTGWNGLAIDALARAGAALSRTDYVAAAARAADFVLKALVVDGGLAHGWKDGVAAVPAFQDDYAALAGGLLSLYEATFDPSWFSAARRLADEMLADFEVEGGGFYRTGPRHELLIVRQQDVVDGSVPSGNALAAAALLRLSAFTGAADYQVAAERLLQRLVPLMLEAPTALGASLAALDDSLAGLREVALVGDPKAPDTGALLAAIRARYVPGLVVALAAPDDKVAAATVPLLAQRGLVDGRAAAYVCRGHLCDRPVVTPEALAAAI